MDYPLEQPTEKQTISLQNVVLLASIVFLLGALAWVFVFRPKPLTGFVLNDPIAVPNFTLTSHTGEPLSLFDLRDKVVLISWGYTSCPDVCPITLATLSNARDQLPARLQNDVQVVFISVDPERDSAERLTAYMNHFDPDHLGLYGTGDDLTMATAPLGIHYEQRPVEGSDNYFIDHTATVAVLDKNGQLRTVYPFGLTAKDIVPDLRRLARE